MHLRSLASMTMAKDEWVRAAMTDDVVVVELLLRLKQAQAAPSSKPPVVIPARWGLRLPRSRPATARCDVSSKRKEGDSSTRCSPTTPLSWSGGGSPSATADGFEETSRNSDRSPSAVRSKVNIPSEAGSNTIKRSRKKKTFAQLKEEESSLLKEKMHLKKDLATMRASLEHQSARNENLKKLKLDLNLNSKNSNSASDELHKTQGEIDDRLQLDSSEKDEAVSNHDKIFLLPDLNMTPEQHSCGMR